MRYHIFYPFTASIVDSRGLLISICKRQQFECDVTSYNVRRYNAKIENRYITEYTESFLWVGNVRWNNSTGQSTKSSGTIIDIEIIVSRWFTPFTSRDNLMVLFGYAIKSIVSCVKLLFIRPWRCKQTTVRIMLGVIISHINVYGSDSLQWHHNECGDVSNHYPHDCLLNVYSNADQSKHQSFAPLAFVWGIHRSPVNSPHKGLVTRKMSQFYDVIVSWSIPLTQWWFS